MTTNGAKYRVNENTSEDEDGQDDDYKDDDDQDDDYEESESSSDDSGTSGDTENDDTDESHSSSEDDEPNEIKKFKLEESIDSLAVTTPIVSKAFEPFFSDQMVACDSNSDNYSDSEEEIPLAKTRERSAPTIFEESKVIWNSVPLKESGIKYYTSVDVDNNLISIGDCVLFHVGPNTEPHIGKVRYMFEEDGEKTFHVTWFWRGNDTILGDFAEKRELFSSHNCDDVPAGSAIRPCTVKYVNPLDKFKGINNKCNGNYEFVYRLRYDSVQASFKEESDNDAEVLGFQFCASCEKRSQYNSFDIPIFDKPVLDSKTGQYESFRLRGEIYKVNDCIYLDPSACKTFTPRHFESAKAFHVSDYDEKIYSERYRKITDKVSGGNSDVSDPFVIGRILNIMKTEEKVNGDELNGDENFIEPKPDFGKLSVGLFYRPENTHLGDSACDTSDFNKLYWSLDEINVALSMVMGKCFVVEASKIDDLQTFLNKGPNRFYVEKAYIARHKVFYRIKGPGTKLKDKTKAIDHPVIPPGKKLCSLDLFAGSGGLSRGLQLAGIVDTRWAVERDKVAATAFKQNNPDCIVFQEDCNRFLDNLLKGELYHDGKIPFPKKGEVDFISGGPPCQGISLMNRNRDEAKSRLKNSLIATMLSICDHYRPRFFLLENVSSFVSYNNQILLRLTLDCLVRMGYQCSFALLQAGHYGLPQTRRRFFIWAAAPGERLPNFPEPTHVFNRVRGRLAVSVLISGERQFIESSLRWTESAPLRCVTVNDAIGDLPEIPIGLPKQKTMQYNNEETSHFQRMMRENSSTLVYDHVTRSCNELNYQRIRHIPRTIGSDWRDLPNIRVIIDGQIIAEKLKYNYYDEHGRRRGVCQCANKKSKCSPIRTPPSLIARYLPHMADKKNQWVGICGRLCLDGHFNTVTTTADTMGKQGCVIHPLQDRVVSVRECARAQGFPDSYRFAGSTIQRYRQVGNAVPPPLAKALGMELRAAVANRQS